jgi:SAP domain
MSNRAKYLSTFKLAKLRAMCAVLNLNTSGRKAQVIARIVQRERDAGSRKVPPTK